MNCLICHAKLMISLQVKFLVGIKLLVIMSNHWTLICLRVFIAYQLPPVIAAVAKSSVCVVELF